MDSQNSLPVIAFFLEEVNRRRKLRSMLRKEFYLKQKKRRIDILNIVCAEYMKSITSLSLTYANRSIWMKQRSGAWWEDIVQSNIAFTDADWLSNFRMDRSTFLEVCRLVDDDLKPKPAFLQPRKPLSTIQHTLNRKHVQNLFKASFRFLCPFLSPISQFFGTARGLAF